MTYEVEVNMNTNISSETLTVLVREIRYESIDVLSLCLEPSDDTPLPPVDPGAHIDIHLANGQVRSYSLSNGLSPRLGYRLTIARDANSTGGSTFVHDEIRVGQTLTISKPRNNFELNEDAKLSVFISGGIGVTPFLPMMVRLNQLNRPWRIHYCVRTPERAPLLQEINILAAEGKGEVLPLFDEEPGAEMLDIKKTLRELPDSAHVYCCGPSGMLDAFRSSADESGLADERVHFEYFSSNVAADTEGGTVLQLMKSNTTVQVQEGQTILDAIIEAGVDVPYSCSEGVCGACETAVLEGEPDHRDMVLSESERAANKTMMVCCSGSKSAKLVLDL